MRRPANRYPISRTTWGESPLMLNLAREIPGFAGVFFEPGGERLVVSLTESNQAEFAEIQQTVMAGLAADASSPSVAEAITPPRLVRRVVEYSFIELARHRARLRSPLFALPGVVSLSVDEEFNRIGIGLEDPAARRAVLDLATELAVPVEMISFSEESPAELLHMSAGNPRLPFSAQHTLDDRIPDGNLRGGYAIEAEGNRGPCTLTFPAVRRSRAGTRLFVSSSHCSRRPFDLDSADVGQPRNTKVVGYEIKDPELHGCGGRECRHADAALNRATADIALGEIGQGADRIYCRSNCEDETTIKVDSGNPTITISGYARSVLDNEVLDKIGMKTGWTYGEVNHTCRDQKSGTDGKVRRCSASAYLGSLGRDSGAPVFRYTDHGNAQLKGIVWGGVEGSTETFFSNYERIERDLGSDMWVYDLGPPVISNIAGPLWVPRGWECGWTSSSSGLYPFHHYWSGILTEFTGEGNWIRGSPEESGWLKLEVVDILDRRVQDSVYVTVVDDGFITGCWPPTR